MGVKLDFRKPQNDFIDSRMSLMYLGQHFRDIDNETGILNKFCKQNRPQTVNFKWKCPKFGILLQTSFSQKKYINFGALECL